MRCVLSSLLDFAVVSRKTFQGCNLKKKIQIKKRKNKEKFRKIRKKKEKKEKTEKTEKTQEKKDKSY